MSITIIGLVREILGAGQAFGKQILPLADASTGKMGYTPISIFILAPGAFFILSLLVAVMNVIRKKVEEKGKPLPAAQGCLADGCEGCGFAASCTGKSAADLKQAKTEVKKETKKEDKKEKVVEEASEEAEETTEE